MNKRSSKVYLVDDHPLFRQGLASLIGRYPDLKVCGEADSTEAALQGIQRERPQVAIVDLSLSAGFAFDLIAAIKAKFPNTAVIVLSMHDEQRYAERCIRAGARGYVMKGETPSTVITALRQVIGGKPYMSEKLRALAVERFVEGSPAVEVLPPDILSPRELEVFQLLGRGYETRRVAEELGLNMKTVQTFCAKIKDKLHLANAAELMREAVRWSELGSSR